MPVARAERPPIGTFRAAAQPWPDACVAADRLGGVLVAPEGPPERNASQWLRRWRKREGKAEVEDIFEVRFVPGAAEDCRRYVVTVTKDRWSTTAPPMEKCGVSTPAASSSKS